MGLVPQLAVTLLCLQACAGTSIHGCKALGEIIPTLDSILKAKTPCTELTVAHIFADSKGASENETLCRAAVVLRQFYFPRGVTRCLISHQEGALLQSLRGLYRTFSLLAPTRNCHVNESTQRTLKNFLENLKTTLQKKYSQCGSATF